MAMSTGEDRPTVPMPDPGQNPGQPWSPPAAPPTYGQPPQAPSYPTQPTYGEQPAYGQPSYGQPTQPNYGQPSYPAQPAYPTQPYGEQPQSSPPAYGQSDPTTPTYTPGYSQPTYAQPASAPPAYGMKPASAPPAYGQPGYPPAYPPYGATPYAPPPAPKSHVGRTIAIIAAAVVVLMLLAGGLFIRFVADKVADTPIANGPSATTSTTTAAPQPTPFSGDLRTLLLTAPNTSRPFRKPFSTDGKLTVAKIATGYTNETQEVNYLNSLGFKQGAIIQWHDANDDQVDIRMYQFGSESDAAEFADTEQGYYTHDDTYADQSPASGIDDSGVYVAKKPDSDKYIETEIVFHKGDIYVEFAMWQQKKANTTVSLELARNQLAKLP